MSWLFSQALVEEYLPAICSDGEPCARSSGMPTQQAYCSPDKMTEFSRLSRFGMTYSRLTDDHGEAVLMSYLEAFPVRTSVQPEKEQELQVNGQECGFTWPESWAKFDPNTSSWRTRQCSLLGDLEPFSETWPRWGTMRNGEFWEQLTLVRRTKEIEFGLLPTPLASIATHGGPNQRDSSGRPGLQMMAMIWPTPTVCGNYNRKGASATSGDGLATAVAKWPTPRTAGMCGGTGSWELLKQNTTIEEARAMGAGNGGTLNPTWVEWLMGWPLAWTDLKPLEMAKFQQWQQQHGEF